MLTSLEKSNIALPWKKTSDDHAFIRTLQFIKIKSRIEIKNTHLLASQSAYRLL